MTQPTLFVCVLCRFSNSAPFSLVNARIGYEWKNTSIYFFVNKLFDKQYITTAFTGFFSDLASYGDRQTFGI